MEGKLVKQEDVYYALYNTEGIFISDVNGGSVANRLSLKNCEAIANVYDLDDLSRERLSTRFNENSGYHKFVFVEAYKEGFLKAMEILGDKKFTEKELAMLFAYGHQIGMNDVLAIQSQHSPQPMPKPDSDKLRDELIQSLQQTEWDVEIVMEKCGYCEGCNKAGMLHCAHADSCGYPIETERPKLDADGCLILKRK